MRETPARRVAGPQRPRGRSWRLFLAGLLTAAAGLAAWRVAAARLDGLGDVLSYGWLDEDSYDEIAFMHAMETAATRSSPTSAPSHGWCGVPTTHAPHDWLMGRCPGVAVWLAPSVDPGPS